MKNKPLLASARIVVLLALLGLGCQRKPAAAPPEPEQKLGVDLGGGVTMDFVLMHPGSFTMGSDQSGEADEKPAHTGTLTKPFWLGKFEVTQEQWQAVTGNNPSEFMGEKNPVDSVSWDDCQEFLAKLNEMAPGHTFRLPTEAEWESACRAGGTGEYCYGDDSRVLGEYAWFNDNDGGTTHPVGGKKPTAWSLQDMHGNVAEWCADWYGPYPAGAATDPTGPAAGRLRVIRGGSWGVFASDCRSASRGWNSPRTRARLFGFRVAAVPAGQ